MVKIAKTMLAALAVGALLIVTPGCEKKGPGGPAEQTGREVDRAVEAGRQIEKAGERIQDAAKGR